MENLINPSVKTIELSGIRKFFNMVSNHQNMISLTIGQPDFHTPRHIRSAGQAAIEQNHTTYTHNAGILPLREAIASFVQEKYSLAYNPETEIITTIGASQAIDVTLRTILEPGDEVILPGPVYPGYEPLITLAGAKPVFADTRKTGFKLTKDLLEAHITSRTKCLIIPYPSNPTGVTLTKQELKELVDTLKDKDIFILADEIYSELVYEQDHVSIASFSEVKDKTIVVNGLSKSHAMTGWRIGFLLAPAWLSQHLLKVHQYNVSCASSVSQYAALAALTEGRNDAGGMKQQYKKRRDFVYQRLTDMDIEVTKPDGAFYFFLKLEAENLSSFELALKLVDEASLALVPGSAFSDCGEGYLRLSYAYDMDTLQEGLNRLEAFLKKNK